MLGVASHAIVAVSSGLAARLLSKELLMHARLLALLTGVGLLLPSLAHAGQVTLTFTGTVANAFGDLSPVLSASDALSGTIVYESTTSGTFTPSPNLTFARSEMLYTGAIVSAEITIVGDSPSGSGGDIKIFDAAEMLAGEDEFRITGTLGAGSIGGVAMSNVFLNPFYTYTNFTVSDGDPVPEPLPFAQVNFFGFNLNSAGGGSANGSIDSFTITSSSAPPSVPALSPSSQLALAIGVMALTAISLSRRFARS
jgi:hypothetical protein